MYDRENIAIVAYIDKNAGSISDAAENTEILSERVFFACGKASVPAYGLHQWENIFPFVFPKGGF